jgi:hypothetical protein
MSNDNPWILQEAIDLCTAIHNLPAQKFNCHPALTGGLLYKTGPRKDCDIVIYQRGDVDGKREPINWDGLWLALGEIGVFMNRDHGYVKKCTYRGKVLDIFDPTVDGGDYGHDQGEELVAVSIVKVGDETDMDILF